MRDADVVVCVRGSGGDASGQRGQQEQHVWKEFWLRPKLRDSSRMADEDFGFDEGAIQEMENGRQEPANPRKRRRLALFMNENSLKVTAPHRDGPTAFPIRSG